MPFTYLQFIFPAVIALNIMYTSVQSAVSVIWDREFGFLREVLVSPMSRGMVLLGKILGGATVAVLHGCLVLILARFADVPLTWTDVLKALGLMVMLAFALTSLGVVIANRIRSFEGFGVFSNAVILPLYFTSSSIFPLDPALTRAQTRVVYPDWLVTIVECNPLTYAVDALRGVLIDYNQFDPWIGIAVMAVACVVLFAHRALRFPPGVRRPMAALRRDCARFRWLRRRAGAARRGHLPAARHLAARGRAGRRAQRLRAADLPAAGHRRSGAARHRHRAAAGRRRRASASTLVLSENRAMGRDFNPRNWGLNRAQCQVIAGGVVDSDSDPLVPRNRPVLCRDRLGDRVAGAARRASTAAPSAR